MKRLATMLMLSVLLLGSSCKKVYITEEVDKKENVIPAEAKPSVSEKLLTNRAEIESINNWYIAFSYPYDQNRELIWKMKSGDKVVVITKPPRELFWIPSYHYAYTGPDKPYFTGIEVYRFLTW